MTDPGWKANRRAQAEEPVEEEPTPEEEPVAVAGAEEPCQGCAALVRERDALVRERDAIRAELGAGLGDALQRTAELARERADLVRRHDEIRLRFCSALGLSAQVEWGSILDRARDLVGGNGDYREQLRAAPAPPLRARRWTAGAWVGHRRVSREQSAGCDCPRCYCACEPIGGWGYRCPSCGLKGEACGATYGDKACELPNGHEGDHESPSGYAWPPHCGRPPRARETSDLLHDLLAAAVSASISRDGEDVYLGLGRHDARLWGLYLRGEEIAAGPDPEELLRGYLRAVEDGALPCRRRK